jgi:uroporphyrinogen decarboxylase
LPVDDHWLLQEMALPSTVRYFSEPDYRAETNRLCNDRCEEVIGFRPFSEVPSGPSMRRIEEVMGSRRELTEGGTPWLERGYETVEAIRVGLDRIERWSDRDLRDVMFAEGGKPVKQERTSDGSKPFATPGSRRPATMATSILGTMNTMFWLVDYPSDMERFFEVLGDIIVRYHNIVEQESGVAYRGYYWLDDNCALYSPNLYERFCLPVMNRVMDAFSPDPEDYRFQHSDSAMAHLLPLLTSLRFHAVNFGPTVSGATIRGFMPHAVIQGVVAPNTLRDRGLEGVVAEVKRDFAEVGGDGGLVVTTCGSISAGTSLESIRGFMWAVQEFCRYDTPAAGLGSRGSGGSRG